MQSAEKSTEEERITFSGETGEMKIGLCVPFCNFYLEEPGATVAGEDAVVLSRGVVGADLARNVVENPTCESK